MVRYKVRLQQSEEGFSVSVPRLPGCWSQGETEAEALDNIRAAIDEYLAARADPVSAAAAPSPSRSTGVRTD